MSRRCSICDHSEREAIDALLIGGTPLRNIAERFALSVTSLHRHKAHISQRLREAKEAEESLSASRLLGDLRRLQAKALELLARAEYYQDLRGALACIREARECIATCAKILETTELERRIEALEQRLLREAK